MPPLDWPRGVPTLSSEAKNFNVSSKKEILLHLGKYGTYTLSTSDNTLECKKEGTKKLGQLEENGSILSFIVPANVCMKTSALIVFNSRIKGPYVIKTKSEEYLYKGEYITLFCEAGDVFELKIQLAE